jgi:hypothetical protein
MDQPQLPDAWQRLRFDFAALLPRAGAAVFILGLFWAAGLALDALLRRFGHTRTLDPDLTGLLARRPANSTLFTNSIRVERREPS